MKPLASLESNLFAIATILTILISPFCSATQPSQPANRFFAPHSNPPISPFDSLDSITYAYPPGPVTRTETRCPSLDSCYCCHITSGGSSTCGKPSTLAQLERQCSCWQVEAYGRVFCTYTASEPEYVVDEWEDDRVVSENGDDVEEGGTEGGGGGGGGEEGQEEEGDGGLPLHMQDVQALREEEGLKRPKHIRLPFVPAACTSGWRRVCECWSEWPGGEVYCGDGSEEDFEDEEGDI